MPAAAAGAAEVEAGAAVRRGVEAAATAGAMLVAGAPAVRGGRMRMLRLLPPSAMRAAERQAAVVAVAVVVAGATTQSAGDVAEGLGRLEAVAGPQPHGLNTTVPRAHSSMIAVVETSLLCRVPP